MNSSPWIVRLALARGVYWAGKYYFKKRFWPIDHPHWASLRKFNEIMKRMYLPEIKEVLNQNALWRNNTRTGCEDRAVRETGHG